MNKRLIISRYNENLDWLDRINFDYLVYNKGENINLPYIRLENIGRETDTYLRFIIEHYNNLPNYLILCQGNPFTHHRDFVNVVNEFSHNDNSVVYLSEHIVNDEPYNHNPENGDIRCDKLLDILNIPYSKNNLLFPAGAQFIIPKDKITNKTIEFWKECLRVCNTYSIMPWVFERVFPIIFEYNNV
jgi:hypothetical protein